MAEIDAILQEQIKYYRDRAGEYDEWFYRMGRYDHGEESNKHWFADVAVVHSALHQIEWAERILELAAGTGIWTQELLKIGKSITAIDSSAEVLAINRSKLNTEDVDRVTFQEANLFAWEPEIVYDMVAACFFLSHVPPERLDTFLDKIARSVRPDGRLFLIDSLNEPTSTASDQPIDPGDEGFSTRHLNEGETYRIVKVFYDPAGLSAKLAAHGFEAEVRTTGVHFWYAIGTKHADPATST